MVKNFNKALLGGLLAASAMALTSGAQAGSVTYNVDPGAIGTELVNSPESLPYFDSSLGTLTGVSVTLTSTINSDGTITNTAAIPETFTETVDSRLTASGGPAPLNSFYAATASFILGLTGHSFDTDPSVSQTFTGVGAGDTVTFDPSPFTSAPLTFTDSTPADLAAFINSGDFTVDLNSVTSQTNTGGGGNQSATLTTSDDVALSITYTYSEPGPPPVPEPASVGLLGAGLAGLAMIRRRFKK